MRASMKWPMRALAITGMLTACMISRILLMGAMRATPPSRRISAGTRSSAMTAAAPAFSAMRAWSALVTSMITPPLSISAKPTLTRNVSSRNIYTPLSRGRPERPPQAEGLPHLNHCGSRFHCGIRPRSFQLAFENPSQRGHTFADLVRREAGEAQTQRAGIEARDREILAGQVRDVFAMRTGQQFAGIQRLGQAHPQIHAAARTGETRSGGQGAGAGGQTRGAGLQHVGAMGGHPSGFGEAQQHGLGKLIGMQVGELLGLGQARDQGARAEYPAHAQAGEGDL